MEKTLQGRVIKVFYVGKGGWASIVLDCGDGEQIKCAGILPGINEGVSVEVTGDYIMHPSYGLQFTVKTSKLIIGNDKREIFAYLSSGAIHGVRAAIAKLIIDKFGNDTLNIIRNHPERLVEVKGISEVKAHVIYNPEKSASTFQALCVYAELSDKQRIVIYEQYQDKSVEIIKNNPYQIIYDISGFGFKTVDKIALKNGINPRNPKRVAAAIQFLLTSIGNEGHCYCTVGALEENLKILIPEVAQEQFSDIIIEEWKKGNVVIEENTIYSGVLYRAEINIANNLVSMLMNKANKVKNEVIHKAIMETEIENGFELEALQKRAITCALQNRVTVITGGSGTGKSTIIKAIAKGWTLANNAYKMEDCVIMCASTGRASRRMSELSGCDDALTVQKLIKQSKNGNIDIKGKLIIADEESMLDIYNANDLLQIAINNRNTLVLIGDVDQLPPIGPGNFFKDLVSSPCIPSITLKLCHRQKGAIAINAKRINDGYGFAALNFSDKSCQFFEVGKHQIREAVLQEYKNLLNKYNARDICCIVPTRKSGKGHTAAKDLNPLIRDMVNPQKEGEDVYDWCEFRVGDRVMNTENDYTLNIFNGDCGIISDIDPLEKIITIEMDDGNIVEIDASKIKYFELAYAVTTYKSQGSEYKAVIITQNMENAFMLSRNLLYTAVTRAKDELIIMGEKQAINLAVRKITALERMTKLKLRIGKAVAELAKLSYSK